MIELQKRAEYTTAGRERSAVPSPVWPCSVAHLHHVLMHRVHAIGHGAMVLDHLRNDLAECPLLQKEFAAPGDRAFVRSSIPTLIVTQEFDDRTPTSHGRRIAEHLTNVRLVEIPAQGHGQPPNACSQSIILAFLADPARAPDVACLKDISPVRFETTNLEPINLIVFIASATGAPHPFAGRWEGTFPGAPVIYRLERTVPGDAVSGRIIGGAQTVPITDGRVIDRSVTFTARPANSDRAVTFVGRLDGDRLAFTRDVTVGPSGAAGGAALSGVRGARAFSLVRVQ